jgi:micrococcal nuclease
MSEHLYRYPARLVEIIDGDTQDFEVDLGFKINRKMRIRLNNVDTAETYGVSHDSEEYKKGKEHTRFVAKWVNGVQDATDAEYPFILETFKDSTGKYGRYLAAVHARYSTDVILPGDEVVADELTEALVNEYPEVLSE